MKRVIVKKKLLAMALSGALVAMFVASASAGSGDLSLREQIEAQQKMIEAQAKLLAELKKKVEAQEEAIKAQTEVQDQDGDLIRAINKHVELSGLVEIEASSAEAFDKTETSDITLANVEVGIDAQVTDWSSAHVLLKYQEGEESNHVFIDEGTISLGNMEKLPLMLTAGKMVVPFGAYNTNMVSDPLTLEMGETNDSAVLVTTEANGFSVSAYAFNGDTDETNEANKIRSFGASAGYAMDNETFSLEAGIDWINNLADSGGMNTYIATTSTTIADKVDGFSAHAMLEAAGFTLTGEYVSSLDNFAAAEVAFNGLGAKPKAYNLEAAYSTELSGKPITLALGYQETDEALALGMAESRYIGAAGIELFPYTSLAIEYFHDEDYDVSDGGTGEDGHTLTMQLGLEY